MADVWCKHARCYLRIATQYHFKAKALHDHLKGCGVDIIGLAPVPRVGTQLPYRYDVEVGAGEGWTTHEVAKKVRERMEILEAHVAHALKIQQALTWLEEE